jgi:nitrate/TMAO reductase-like tetraheme cytochrome c subunit
LYATVIFSIGLLALPSAYAQERMSGATEECLNCHSTLHPGIVGSWQKSRHARVTLLEASNVEGLGKKVSFDRDVPDGLKNVVVGCAECHTVEPKTHADTFEHNGYEIHVVVSPKDCATCHKNEAVQYQDNLMSQAYGNLMGNSLYRMLVDSVNSVPSGFGAGPPVRGDLTDADSCLYCHGTKMTVSGVRSRETELGPMEFPVISGWPNQGVGRINPDGSKGSCTSCHSRHDFSVEMARKPYACKECHGGPDVPAYKVYETSKHGNIFSAAQKEWDFNNTGWTVGKDFTAPTCAACHISLLVNAEGKVVASRTHEMKDRLPWRIFGLVYAHPHPKEADTSIIRNADGLPLPTCFGAGVSENFLRTKEQMAAAQQKMQSICLTCHAQSWVDGHWGRFVNTIESTNSAVFSATKIMLDAWGRGLATNHSKAGSLFDESIEKLWTDVWLIYANSVRFASAMGGGGDYGVFADGRYQLKKTMQQMKEWAESRKEAKSKAKY